MTTLCCLVADDLGRDHARSGNVHGVIGFRIIVSPLVAYVLTHVWDNIGSGKVLLLSSTKPLAKPMLTRCR